MRDVKKLNWRQKLEIDAFSCVREITSSVEKTILLQVRDYFQVCCGASSSCHSHFNTVAAAAAAAPVVREPIRCLPFWCNTFALLQPLNLAKSSYPQILNSHFFHQHSWKQRSVCEIGSKVAELLITQFKKKKKLQR